MKADRETCLALAVLQLSLLSVLIVTFLAIPHPTTTTARVYEQLVPMPTQSSACAVVLWHDYFWPGTFREDEIHASRCWEPV
jgi:hypothetical protein